MSHQKQAPDRYVRCGPFNQGIYAQVPTHQFTRRVAVERAPGLLGDVEFWACAYCHTTVSGERRAEAETHPCDGRVRCAICNIYISWPFRRCSGTRMGVLCQACNEAADQALRVTP